MKVEDAKFYNYFRSSASYRVRIALGLKELTAREVIDVDLRAGEQSSDAYLKIAPSGLVPALAFEEGSFSQSLALIEWLDGEYPANRLIPSDRMTALAVREIAYAISCDIHPVNNLRILNYLRGPLAADEAAIDRWYAHWVGLGFDGIEPLLERHAGKGPFCVGQGPTLADVCLVPQVFNARRFKVDLTNYPRICAVADACNAIPAFANAAP